MSNQVTSRVIQDGSRNYVVTVAGILDSDLASQLITDVASLNPRPQLIRLDRVFFSIEDGISCLLWWEATADQLIMPISGRGTFDVEWFSGDTNTKSVGYTGNVKLSTQGFTAGIKHFFLALDFVKQGV